MATDCGGASVPSMWRADRSASGYDADGACLLERLTAEAVVDHDGVLSVGGREDRERRERASRWTRKDGVARQREGGMRLTGTALV